jgi:hypothetical protein
MSTLRVDNLVRTDGTSMDVGNSRLLADLEALTGTDGQQATTSGRTAIGDGGGGAFIWNSSDLSTEVTADTEAGSYVAPTSDTTGARGAWVRSQVGGINPVWFGADPTGVADSWPAFFAAITLALSSGRQVSIPAGRFLDVTSIRIAVGSSLTMVGAGKGVTTLVDGFKLDVTGADACTFSDFTWEGSNDQCIFTTCTKTTFKNLRFDQTGSGSVSPDGIRLIECTNTKINKCDFYNANYAVILAQVGATAANKNTEVSECHFFNSVNTFPYPAGVFVVAGINTRIINNHFEYPGAATFGYGIYQGDNSTFYSSGMIIIGNTFKNSNYADIKISRCKDVIISGNISTLSNIFAFLDGTLVLAEEGVYPSNYKIIGNTVEGYVNLTGQLYDVLIDGNTFHNSPKGVKTYGDTTTETIRDVVISNNLIRGVEDDGVLIQNTTNVVIEGNRIFDANTNNTADGTGFENAAINLYAGANEITVRGNYAENTGTGHAKYGVNVYDPVAYPDVNIQGDNHFVGMETENYLNYPMPEYIISVGVISPSHSYKQYISVDSEALAVTDDLDTITADNYRRGDSLVIRAADNTRSIVIKNATGNIFCGADITLADKKDMVILIHTVYGWSLISSSINS